MKTVVGQSDCEATAAKSNSRTIAAMVEITAAVVMMIGTVFVNMMDEVLLQADLMIAALLQVDSVGVVEEVGPEEVVAVEDMAVVATRKAYSRLVDTKL